MAKRPSFLASAFGLLWAADIALPYFTAATSAQNADVTVQRVETLPPREALTILNRGFIAADGIRFQWLNQVTFDMFDGCRVEYCVGPDWSGELPAAFFSTVTALILAWRAMVPFHGCAVELAGQGFLICGDGGKGKSSLTAGLIAQGARFISDDLSVIDWRRETGEFALFPGRKSMRLHPETAQWIDAESRTADANDARGKLIVVPAAGQAEQPVRFAGMILLDGHTNAVPIVYYYKVISRLLFRHKWMTQLPQAEKMQEKLRKLSVNMQLRCVNVPKFTDFDSFEREATIIRDVMIDMLATKKMP